MTTLSRRGLIGSMALLFVAPAIVRAGSLMPVRAFCPVPRVLGLTLLIGPDGAAAYCAGDSRWFALDLSSDDLFRMGSLGFPEFLKAT